MRTFSTRNNRTAVHFPRYQSVNSDNQRDKNFLFAFSNAMPKLEARAFKFESTDP